jgi:hypothetical protein
MFLSHHFFVGQVSVGLTMGGNMAAAAAAACPLAKKDADPMRD